MLPKIKGFWTAFDETGIDHVAALLDSDVAGPDQ